METLETLSKFVEKYPQKKNRKLQYSFLGGTAVRLIQESIGWKYKRPISDFDILVFGGEPYPVHQCTPDNVFGVISSNVGSLRKYISCLNLKDKRYYHMNAPFLALTKTCAIDTPREKDFEDVKFLYDSGLINNQLKHLFANANRLTKNSDLALETFNWFFEGDDPNKVKLFQTFPRFVNILNEFNNPKEIKNLLLEYTQRDKDKSGYQLASVIYDSHSLLRELGHMSEQKKKEVLKKLLNIAEKNDYADFDRIVHENFVPKVRYSIPKERERFLRSLLTKKV